MLFCHALRSEKRYLPHRKLGEDFTFTLFEKANVVDEKSWTEIAGKQNLFFNLEFLHLVQKDLLYRTVVCSKRDVRYRLRLTVV